jgi:hypothetical protein
MLGLLLVIGAVGAALVLTKHTVGMHILGYTLAAISFSGFATAAWAWLGGANANP